MYTMITNLYKYTYGLRLVKKKKSQKTKSVWTEITVDKKNLQYP